MSARISIWKELESLLRIDLVPSITFQSCDHFAMSLFTFQSCDNFAMSSFTFQSCAADQAALKQLMYRPVRKLAPFGPSHAQSSRVFFVSASMTSAADHVSLKSVGLLSIAQRQLSAKQSSASAETLSMPGLSLDVSVSVSSTCCCSHAIVCVCVCVSSISFVRMYGVLNTITQTCEDLRTLLPT